MHIIARAMALCAVSAAVAGAQQPDSVRAKARADSIARAQQDSIALVREMEKALAQPTARSAPAAPSQSGPINPRLLPDISAVGDFVGDLSPKGTTQEDGSRLGVREVELAFQAAVDPYFRGDVFLGINDVEKIAIEQAYLTATALPYHLEARLGRFLMPFGKQNTTHRHDLHTVEYPWVIQRFFGPEGLKGTGVYVARVFAPFGFYQELQVTGIDRLGEASGDARLLEPVNKELGGLGFSARLRNYWDLSQSTNIELSASGITGRVEHPVSFIPPNGVGERTGEFSGTAINAVAARQTVAGIDFTFRWRPLQQGLYHSFIFQAEAMRQVNRHSNVSLTCADIGLPPAECSTTFDDGPRGDGTGGYAFARVQLSQRGYLGVRVDEVKEAPPFGGTTKAGSGYLEWFPSEFSKLVAAYERYMPPGGEQALNRILLQASFALGPHKPHPF
jgi:hypothetical protein